MWWTRMSWSPATGRTRWHGGALRGPPAALAQLERLGCAALPSLPRTRFGSTRVARAGQLAAGGSAAEAGAAASVSAQADGAEPLKDTTEHLRVRLAKWCETGVEKITEDMEELEMHSAVRNVMRLSTGSGTSRSACWPASRSLARPTARHCWRRSPCWCSCSARSPRIWPRSCGWRWATKRMQHKRRGQAYRYG